MYFLKMMCYNSILISKNKPLLKRFNTTLIRLMKEKMIGL